MYRIMIVDDSREIREELAILLRSNGYEVQVLCDFSDIAKSVEELSPHLVLLDVNLPREDGFKLCERIRKRTQVPIIFVTSRNTELDELMSMTIGGDDFIAKPYNASILLARISALIKRVYVRHGQEENRISVGGVTLDLSAGTVESEGNSAELTKNELKILYCLMRRKGEIVSRNSIVEYLWDNQMYVDDNTLSVNIARIRAKLEGIGVREFIATKRGLGYQV